MADQRVVNGVSSPGAENPHGADLQGLESEVNALSHRVKSLEREKFDLLRENDEAKEKVRQLMLEVERLKGDEKEMRVKLDRMEKEIELAEDGKRAMDSIMKRAADLEMEVSRLQHDLISAMNDARDANEEVEQLRSTVEEKEKILKGLEVEVESAKNRKAESEAKLRELERKIGVMEVRESEAKPEKVRVEVEFREKIEEKEKEIRGLKERVENLEAALKDDSEIQSLKNAKRGMEDALKASEEKAQGMELKLVKLQRELEQAEKVICGLREKLADMINGKREVVDATEDKGLKLQWPMVATGSIGAIVLAAAMGYVCYSRRQS